MEKTGMQSVLKFKALNIVLIGCTILLSGQTFASNWYLKDGIYCVNGQGKYDPDVLLKSKEHKCTEFSKSARSDSKRILTCRSSHPQFKGPLILFHTEEACLKSGGLIKENNDPKAIRKKWLENYNRNNLWVNVIDSCSGKKIECENDPITPQKYIASKHKKMVEAGISCINTFESALLTRAINPMMKMKYYCADEVGFCSLDVSWHETKAECIEKYPIKSD